MVLSGLAGGGLITTERLTSSLSAYQPNIANAVKRRTPLLNAMLKRKKLYSGGTEAAVRIRYRRSAKLGQSGGTGVWSYYDQLSTAPTDTIRAMGEGFSNFNQPVTMSLQEEWENDGERAFDRLKEAVTHAEDDLADDGNEVFWGISGGDGNKLPTPITDIISGADTMTLYGVSKSSTANTWLNSQEVNAVGDLETELLDAMREGELLCIDNAPSKADKIDFWITHRDVYLGLQKVLGQYVMVDSTKDADLGFDQLYLNKVAIGWDSDCPLDVDQKYQMFGMMTKYWEVPTRRQANFTTSKFYDMMPEQAAKCAQIFWTFAVVCNNPRTNVRIKGIEL